MKTATIYAVPAAKNSDFEWKWRCDAEQVGSPKSFTFYYDCLTDAVAHGYRVEMTRAEGLTAPGGAAYELEQGNRS